MANLHARKQNASARRLLATDILERWPHICRVKITFALLPTNSSVSTTMNSMKCLVNWIPLMFCASPSFPLPSLQPNPQSPFLPHAGHFDIHSSYYFSYVFMFSSSLRLFHILRFTLNHNNIQLHHV